MVCDMGKLHRVPETALETKNNFDGIFCSESLQNPIDLLWGANL